MNHVTPKNGQWKKRLAVLLSCSVLSAGMTLSALALQPQGNGLVIRDWVTNRTDYTFSDAYKTSVWYSNFSALSLSDNARNNVLRIALSQLGYHEGNSASDLHGKNQNGTGNYIEYARLVIPPYNNNHYEWCACFVNWCLNQAGIDYAYGEISCWKWATWLKNHQMFQHSAAYKGTYEPQPADFIFFSWDGVNTTSNHIGLVLYTTSTHVYTIEGNSSDRVAIRSYSRKDPCIIGYGTPPYEQGKEQTISYRPEDQRVPGRYIVNSTSGASIRLYTDKSTSSAYKTIPNGTMVTIPTRTATADKWVFVQSGDTSGYILNSSTVTISLLSPATYTLTYSANGGTLLQDVSQDGFCYSEQRVSDIIPAKENAIFLGWSFDRNATDRDALLGADDTVILEAPEMTLYAVWRDIPIETETIGRTDDTDDDAPKSETSSLDLDTTAEDDSTRIVTTTAVAPETLTTITGGAELAGASGCGAVIPAITSVFVPVSLAALLMWRKKCDDQDQNK